MKKRILGLFLIVAGTITMNAQIEGCDPLCIDTVKASLTLLSKDNSNAPDCAFSVKFCIRKTTAEADHVDYSVYHTNGHLNKTVDITGIQVDSVICEIFSFVADCNSTASFFAVGKEKNNSICGIVSDLIILPIRLLNFSAEVQKAGDTYLKWQTASESNASHFIIQQSQNGKIFQDIAKIKATGESNTLKSYSYVGKPNSTSTASAISYYRLKMVDRDESFSYSQIIRTGKHGSLKFEIYPNPASHFLKIYGDDLLSENLKMINIQGKELELSWIDGNTLDIQNVYPGIYFVKYQDGVIRFIKR